MQRMPHKLIHALILRRGNRHHRNPEHGLHPIDVDGTVILLHLVHHVECHHHGHIHHQQLNGQIQIALDIRGVHDIDDRLRLVLQDKISGDDFLAGIGRHRIYAGKVCDQRVRMPLDRPILSVHCDARKIPDVLICAGQLIEQCRLAAVLIAHKCEGENRSLRQRLSISLVMVETAVLAESRMVRRLNLLHPDMLVGSLRDPSHPDLSGVVQPQRQLIAVNLQLHRISHRRKFHDCRLRSRNHTHVQKMLTERPLASDLRDHGTLSNLQIL